MSYVVSGLVFALLVPALAHAATLENPGNGSFYSGIGVVSGWKCSTNGRLTVRFNGGNAIPLAYRNERSDTRGSCGDTDNGFVAIWNYGNLGDGTHTAVVYDNGREFARSTFTVTTLGEAFVRGASGECTISNFPESGETTTFEWNQNTQNLLATEWDGGGNGGGNGGGSDECPRHDSYFCRNEPAEQSGTDGCITLERGGDRPWAWVWVNRCNRRVVMKGACMEDKGETDRFIETSDGYQLYTWAHVFGLWSVGPNDYYPCVSCGYCSTPGYVTFITCYDEDETDFVADPVPYLTSPDGSKYICFN